MSDLMSRGLPVLQGLIGLPYGVSGTLVVEEAAPTRLGDYAGTYTQATATILVRYDADAYVALHEAAHVWFNETLVDQRWINEGFAELYGVHAATAIGEQGDPFSLTDDLLKQRIPLNDWGLPVNPRPRYRALRLRGQLPGGRADPGASRPGRAARRLEGHRRR